MQGNKWDGQFHLQSETPSYSVKEASPGKPDIVSLGSGIESPAHKVFSEAVLRIECVHNWIVGVITMCVHIKLSR